MTKKKFALTLWFPADMAPVRIGVYEKCFLAAPEYQYWDGQFWHYGSKSPTATFSIFKQGEGARPNSRKWRSLAQNPKAKS